MECVSLKDLSLTWFWNVPPLLFNELNLYNLHICWIFCTFYYRQCILFLVYILIVKDFQFSNRWSRYDSIKVDWYQLTERLFFIIINAMKSLKKHRFLLFYIDARDVHDGSVAAAPAVAVAAVNFSLPSRQLPKNFF